jgi:hypothetical protein
MQNNLSFLPKLSLGLDIWEVSIDVVSRSFALNGPKRLAAAGLEPGITAQTRGRGKCTICMHGVEIFT